MLYLPKSKIKLYFILLLTLLFLNVAFVSSAKYSASTGTIEITNASEDQYLSLLNSFPPKYQAEFINNSHKTYLYIFPEISIVIIYFGYFLIATLFIFSIKFNQNESAKE